MLKIGDFSRLARVTVKTLRFYDDAGLFRPAYVEPRSGYRFYRAEQLRALRRVRLLRHLGLSVREVRELSPLASDSPEYLERLAALRERLLLSVVHDAQRLRQLDALIRGRGTPPHREGPLPISEMSLPAVSALTLRARVCSLDGKVQNMFETIERRAARCGCRVATSPFLLFHDLEYRDKQVDVEACVPVRADSLGVCGGRIVEGVERAAVLRFAGSYAQAPRLYERLLEWMDQAGTQIGGAIRETYLRFGAEQEGYTLPAELLATRVADYETELQIPLAAA
ncbi:MAG TPA: MerR family transcriptional regulator [Steroidobacteraceae bacterium]|nr:MerR family transcriptional regulator [Steroidobacteraceae bacterium]